MTKIISNLPPFAKFFFASMLTVVMVVVVALVGVLIGNMVFSCTVEEFLNAVRMPEISENISIIRYYLFLQTFVLFGVPPIVFLIVYGDTLLVDYKFNRVKKIPLLLLSLSVVLLAMPFINFLGEFNGLVIDQLLGEVNGLKESELAAERLLRPLLTEGSVTGLFINIFVMAAMPALCEELFFRGLVQQYILRKTNNTFMAVLGAGFLFSFIHFQFYGFLPRLVLGMYLGYLLVWSGSLWLPILAHFLNNLIAIVGNYFISKQMLPVSFEKVGGEGNSVFVGMVSGIVVLFIVFKLFEKYNAPVNPQKLF